MGKLLTIGAIGAAILTAIAVLGSRSDDVTIKHLHWKSGPQVSADEFYSALKLTFENRGKAGIERDGDVFVMNTSGCDKIMADMESLIPNGVEVRCKTSGQTVWVLDRR